MKNSTIKIVLAITTVGIPILVILAYIFSDGLFESESAKSIHQIEFNVPLSSFMSKE